MKAVGWSTDCSCKGSVECIFPCQWPAGSDHQHVGRSAQRVLSEWLNNEGIILGSNVHLQLSCFPSRNITAGSHRSAGMSVGCGKPTTVLVTKPPSRSMRSWVRLPVRPTARIRWSVTMATPSMEQEGRAPMTRMTMSFVASVECTRTKAWWSNVKSAW